MTRRGFLCMLAAAPIPSAAAARVSVPVHRIVDAQARCTPQMLQNFWSAIWPQAFQDYSQGGIDLQTTDGPGEVRHTAADRPVFVGLRRGVVNLILTDHLPLYWDAGRALAGVTTIFEGYHVCMIALRYAHGNQVPFLSVNTCVHELLHALLQDVFVTRPKWYQSGSREFRIDYYATLLWLFHDGAAIRQSARVYVQRLRAAAPYSTRNPMPSIFPSGVKAMRASAEPFSNFTS
jgi:hypothetical protein